MAGEPFVFNTELRLVALTGTSAQTLAELRTGLAEVPGSSIFHHTHHKYVVRHFQKPIYYNDFALWASQALRNDVLAEQLAALDLLTFVSVRELREAIIRVVDVHLADPMRAAERCDPGEAFHFCRSRSFVLPTDFVARDVPGFFDTLPRVSNSSVYFHYFEARLRLGAPTNDFSLWLSDMGRPDLAAAIDGLNPYIRTLDELKQEIVEIGRGAGS